MQTRFTSLAALGLAATISAQDPFAARVERAAAMRHYAAVEAELRAAPSPADAATAARRAQVLDLLGEYRTRGVFGIDLAPNGCRVPRFVDDDGRRCAVAWLLDRTGGDALTLAVHRANNLTWVAGLGDDAQFAAWLAHHGLSLAEAARIQFPPHAGIPSAPPQERPEPSRRSVEGNPGGSGDVVSRATTQPAPASAAPATPTPPGNVQLPTGRIAARGMSVEALEAPAWINWWIWNRGAFELPVGSPSMSEPIGTGTTVATRLDVQAVLEKLARGPHPAVRAAAVQALGRLGATTTVLTPFLDDSAREVRLATLLALGAGGSAAHVHTLAKLTTPAQKGDTLAVAFAALALLDDGPMRQMLASTVADAVVDPRPGVQAAAAIAMAEHDEATRHDAVRRLLRDGETPLQRAMAAHILGPQADNADVATLTSLLNERNLDVRRSAALALGRSRHALALPALQTAFEMEHELGTLSAQLFAMGDHRGDAAKAFLSNVLANGSKTLRGTAAVALGLWGRDRDDVDEIAGAITTAYGTEANRDQKGAYLLALGLLRHTASRDVITAGLAKGNPSATRGAAAAALGLLGDAAAVDVLAKTLVDDDCPWCRQQAARALASLGETAVSVLVGAMTNDKDADVRSAAAWALGGIGSGDATEALMDFAGRDDVPAAARAGAALALGRAFRQHEPKLPAIRFQQDNLLLPDITEWAFAQEL